MTQSVKRPCNVRWLDAKRRGARFICIRMGFWCKTGLEVAEVKYHFSSKGFRSQIDRLSVLVCWYVGFNVLFDSGKVYD